MQKFSGKISLTEGEGGGTPVCPPAKKEYRDDPFHQVRKNLCSRYHLQNETNRTHLKCLLVLLDKVFA